MDWIAFLEWEERQDFKFKSKLDYYLAQIAMEFARSRVTDVEIWKSYKIEQYLIPFTFKDEETEEEEPEREATPEERRNYAMLSKISVAARFGFSPEIFANAQ